MSVAPKKSDKELESSSQKINLTVATVGGTTTRKKPVNVLDEDTFLTNLEEIIEKDFFPDLEKLKLQQAYYDAVRNNDYETIQELLSKYNTLTEAQETPRTPAYFDTPKKSNETTSEKPYSNSEPPKKKNMSVDKYLSQNTSEDNISFEVLMAESKKKEQTKVINQWLFEKERFHSLKYESSLQLQDDDHFDDITKSLDSWPYKSKNTLMYNPEGVSLTDEELLDKAKKTRVINHSNTRFNATIADSLKKGSSQTLKTPDTDSPYVTNLLNPAPKIGVDGKELTSNQTPRVKGYGFVDASPSPMPGRSFGDESPMMTWGEIDSTPFRLDNSATPYFSKTPNGPEFKIPDVPEREKLLFDLEEKNNAARRKRKNDAVAQVQRNLASPNSKTPKHVALGSLSERINSMSPAAKQLLSMKLNVRTSDKSANSSPYTPKNNNATPRASPFNSLNSPVVKTPSSQTIDNLRSNVKRSTTTESITDNLLKLPKMT